MGIPIRTVSKGEEYLEIVKNPGTAGDRR